MAFNQESADTPTSIGIIIVTLKDAITGGGETGDDPYQSAGFRVEILDQNGSRMAMRNGNLAPHITPAQRTALMDFMDSLRVQAAAQILS